MGDLTEIYEIKKLDQALPGGPVLSTCLPMLGTQFDPWCGAKSPPYSEATKSVLWSLCVTAKIRYSQVSKYSFKKLNQTYKDSGD